MHQWIAIDFTGGGLQELASVMTCEFEHVENAQHGCEGGGHRVALVMDGGGRTGQVIDAVQWFVASEWRSNVPFNETEMGMVQQ